MNLPARTRLMVLDAENDVRELIQGALKDMPDGIVFCASGEGIGAARRDNFRFDAIVMDLSSPIERSFELVRTFKRKLPGIEIILISRLADDRLWIQSLEYGAFDLLPKPLEQRELLACLKRAILHRQAVSNNYSTGAIHRTGIWQTI